MEHEMITGFREKLSDAGIRAGDLLYVAADTRFIMAKLMQQKALEQLDEVFNELTDELQKQVTPEGTLMMPVFSWDFCRGRGFDYYQTRGETGAYSNWVLDRRKDFRRTQHPMYSFMVWGKDADFLCSMSNQDAWGEASPFYYLLKHGGKQLDLNVDSFRSLTFIHCFEQWTNVPYRHPKYFFGRYKDEHGSSEIRSYSMFVRDLDVYEHSKTSHEYLAEHGAARQVAWNTEKLTLIDIAKCYEVVKDDILNNNGANNLRFKDYVFSMSNERRTPYEVGAVPA